MDNHGIVLLGLGPGDPNKLTREAWEVIESTPEIYLRTKQHPVVTSFPTTLSVHSFDNLYETASTFEAVYEQIVVDIIELGMRPEGVVYAVPGHPLVAEATGMAIARRAKKVGVALRVIDGLSFLEPMFTLLGVDPFPHTALVDALELAVQHVPPFPPSAPVVIAQIHSKAVASEVKLCLMGVYPDEHRVQLIHAAGTFNASVESLALYEIDRSDKIGLLTALYIPAMEENTSFEAFQEIIAHLRAPDGCPWDREQTHQTLRSHLLEESYEVLEALDDDDAEAMREEFGDLLLQIVLHAQIASEYGQFSMVDILRGVHNKIVNRHPHVFAGLELDGVSGVLSNWEKLKAAERIANGKAESSLLDGIATALPALAQADQYQRRAARVGFDWQDIQGVFDKVNEEMAEVRSANNEMERSQEIGDLLFATVNLARWYGIDAESALREANTRFRSRFNQMEKSVWSQGRSLSELTPDELESLWQVAKGTSGNQS